MNFVIKYLLAGFLLSACLSAPVCAQWQVAVFPHENRSPQSDDAWFERAFVEAVMYAFYRVPQVRVVDEDILRDALGDQWANLVGNRTLADRAQIHIALRGNYLFGQDSVQIQTDIVVAESGKIRRSVVSRAPRDNPLKAVESLVFALAENLNVPLDGIEITAITRPVMDLPDALVTAIEAIQTFRQVMRQSAPDRALLEQAEMGLKRAAQQAPNSALPHVYLGRIYEAQSRIAAAELAYRDALKVDFDHVEARYRLALMLKAQGRDSEALIELDQAMRQSPIDPLIQKEMSGIFFNQYSQAFEMVVAQLKQSIQAHPDDPTAYYELGNAYDELQRYDEAALYYQQALARDSSLADVHFKLGLVYHTQGHYDKAVRHLYSAAAHGTQYNRVYFRLGEVLFFLERYQQAVTQFARALEAEPNYSIPRYYLGLCQFKLGQIDVAFDTFQTYANFTTDDHRPHFQLGEIYRQRGDIDKAIQAYQQAIDISPRYIEARYRLAYLLAQRDRRDEAIRQLEIVLRLRPDHVEAESMRRDIARWQK